MFLPQKSTAFLSLNSGSYRTKSVPCSLSHIPFTFSDLSLNFNLSNQFQKSEFIVSWECTKYRVMFTENIIHLAKGKLLQKLFQFFHEKHPFEVKCEVSVTKGAVMLSTSKGERSPSNITGSFPSVPFKSAVWLKPSKHFVLIYCTPSV